MGDEFPPFSIGFNCRPTEPIEPVSPNMAKSKGEEERAIELKTGFEEIGMSQEDMAILGMDDGYHDARAVKTVRGLKR